MIVQNVLKTPTVLIDKCARTKDVLIHAIVASEHSVESIIIMQLVCVHLVTLVMHTILVIEVSYIPSFQDSTLYLEWN